MPIHAGWRGCGLCSIARNCCRSKSKHLRNTNLGTGSFFPLSVHFALFLNSFSSFWHLIACIFDVVTRMHVKKKTCVYFVLFFSCLHIFGRRQPHTVYSDHFDCYALLCLTVMINCVLLYCFTVYDLTVYAS